MAKVIAEIGINHNGDLNIAKNLIAMAKEAGADLVKFQMRTVGTVYDGQLEDPRNDGNPFGWKTVGEQKNGIEFNREQYERIDAFCDDIGIDWFASCWDHASFLRHKSFENKHNKIASAMITNVKFCEQVAAEREPTFISTGGCELVDIAKVCEIFSQFSCEFYLMHCVSLYPCPDEMLNLNMIHTLDEEFSGYKFYRGIGYSGHEVGLWPSILAIGMGAKYIERHITIDRAMYGSDQAASMEYSGLKTLCEVAHNADIWFGSGIKFYGPKEREVMKKLRYWEE